MARIVAFDCETHLIQPGLLAPPLVCASIAGHGRDPELLDKARARHEFLQILEDLSAVLAGANIPYDLLVMAVDLALQGVDILPLIFAKYEAGGIFDVQISEPLHAIANGHLNKYSDGRRFEKGRYSLDQCVRLVLGRDNAKANDEWRLRYAELEHVPMRDWPFTARTYPVDDSVNTWDCAERQVVTRDNLHDVSAQCYAHWAMHLASAWGMLVDPEAVVALRAQAEGDWLRGVSRFSREGLLHSEGKKDLPNIKTRIAKAFGCGGKCPNCEGCGQTIADKTGNPIQCKGCSATGLHLDSAPVPRTPTGGISAGRDTLSESGDELLIEFAGWLEGEKLRSTYLPYLEKGIGVDGQAVPISPRPNPLLASGRAAYQGVIQLLPRGGGIRECFVPRPGWVYCSSDYEGLELATHAQSCLWILGESKLAEAINSGVKVHDALGASLAGVSYEHMVANRSTDKNLGNVRQASKPPNFGFPGGMGASRLVLQQRSQGPDTTTKEGRTYKGLRFCVLMRGREDCGAEKVTEWKGKPLPPTCKECIKCAEGIRTVWFKQWPENRAYFRHISDCAERGYIIQHVSRRKRTADPSEGSAFCALANSYFQGLAADGAKFALTQVAREQYTDRSSALYGSRTVLFLHDEIIMEVREDQAHEAAQRLSKVMVDSMRRFTPDVGIKAEPALMRRWYKGAEAVYEKGRLVPWEPENPRT